MEIFLTKILPRAPVLCALAFSLTALSSAQAGAFVAASPMNAPRTFHSATLLGDGRVLVAGGVAGGRGLASAELFDPATGKWTPTGDMHHPRNRHSAILLSDGEVLVIGGIGNTNAFPELFNPASGKWAELPAPANLHCNANPATLLPGGKVLVRGARVVKSGQPAGQEIFDPLAGTWRPAAPMATEFSSPTATLLRNGQVLVAGANNNGNTIPARAFDEPGIRNNKDKITALPAHSELYNPATDRWMTITNPFLWVTSGTHTATLLMDGRVLFLGSEYINDPNPKTHIYDPAGGTWTASAPLKTPRTDQTATLLRDGTVLVTGGRPPRSIHSLATAELFVPDSGKWMPTAGPMTKPRVYHAATLLRDGRVLITGGFENGAGATAEIYDPQTSL